MQVIFPILRRTCKAFTCALVKKAKSAMKVQGSIGQPSLSVSKKALRFLLNWLQCQQIKIAWMSLIQTLTTKPLMFNYNERINWTIAKTGLVPKKIIIMTRHFIKHCRAWYGQGTYRAR